MKRLSVGLPSEIEKLVLDMRKSDEYCMCSCAEILRMLMIAGADAMKEKQGPEQEPA